MSSRRAQRRPQYVATCRPFIGPGDTLYLPRGWLHEAATSDSDSLHLTIGITAYTWLDAARDALGECEDELVLRRGAVDADSDRLVGMFAEQLEPAAVERRRRRRLRDSRRPIREDGLSQGRALQALSADSMVERRETVIADLEEHDDGLALLFEGKEIRFPAHAATEVEACFGAEEPFRATELPGELDTEGRLVLVRRLVREGFLRIVNG